MSVQCTENPQAVFLSATNLQHPPCGQILHTFSRAHHFKFPHACSKTASHSVKLSSSFLLLLHSQKKRDFPSRKTFICSHYSNEITFIWFPPSHCAIVRGIDAFHEGSMWLWFMSEHLPSSVRCPTDKHQSSLYFPAVRSGSVSGSISSSWMCKQK